LGTNLAEVDDKELPYAHPPPQLNYHVGNCNPICRHANNKKQTTFICRTVEHQISKNNCVCSEYFNLIQVITITSSEKKINLSSKKKILEVSN